MRSQLATRASLLDLRADRLGQQRRQRQAPDSERALEAEPVAATQHDPGVERQRRADCVGQLLARVLAQGRELGREGLEGGLAQLLACLLAALDQRRMVDELA